MVIGEEAPGSLGFHEALEDAAFGFGKVHQNQAVHYPAELVIYIESDYLPAELQVMFQQDGHPLPIRLNFRN